MPFFDFGVKPVEFGVKPVEERLELDMANSLLQHR